MSMPIPRLTVFSLLVLSLAARADSWEQLFPTGTVPEARHSHFAVWTGNEMIIWGGANADGTLNSGGRYNPSTNTWSPVSGVGAPTARKSHAGVWTGREMIIWGGTSDSAIISTLNNGGCYNPTTDAWTPTNADGAPGARSDHSAVWTGERMILWGGYGSDSYLNSGGIYDPASADWTETNLAQAPSVRYHHTAVWAGAEMLIWGGLAGAGGAMNSGGRYNPMANRWGALATVGAPARRFLHTAVWTGDNMIIWGGIHTAGESSVPHNNGGRYEPAQDRWFPISIEGAPAARSGHTAVWTGSTMNIWGGSPGGTTAMPGGGLYNPTTDRWIKMRASGEPAGRRLHTAVWTGHQMIVWGGSSDSQYFNDLFIYTPDAPEVDAFCIQDVVIDGGQLRVSFLSTIGRSYTLWRSANAKNGEWTDAGLPSLPGTGGILTFRLPVPQAERLFVRVQSAL